ncbi:MAG: fructose PTS transporter subunit IIB, partial [Deferribacteraceae bacterium]|nr:fructose PTS transporter subunit IIB [Deferribacteraceae bacterium]
MAYKIIASTGCPTGIAHTFMAKEALIKAANAAGVTIKVETHGQVGIENEFTAEDIRDAECVIIAADKDVHPERFAGKRLIQTSVGKGIKNAKELIQDAIDGKGSIYMPEGAATAAKTVTTDTGANESIGRQIYKHLMNGVSHMLPFVVAGGVLIALSFLWGIFSANPEHEEYNKFAAMLMKIGGVSMGMMVPVLSAFIAESISKRPGMIAGFVGGLIASTGGTG